MNSEHVCVTRRSSLLLIALSILVLFIAAPLLAAAPKPPRAAQPASRPAHAAATLPEELLKEGWINLFDGETLYGWQTVGRAEWKVLDGAMVCADGASGLIATTSQFSDFELTFKINISSHEPPPPPMDPALVAARAKKLGVSPKALTARPPVKAEDCTAGIVLRGGLEGHDTESGAGSIVAAGVKDPDAWQEVRVVARGGSYKAVVNGQEYPEHKFGRGRGHIAFQYHPAKRCKVQIKDIQLRPLGMKSIFNGTDLAGWSVIPGHKSEFTVEDGAIRIRNGNGQIETTGVYKDFLLQLEGISNADHINGGVFYRGTPGSFWSGYEIQVKNEWKGDDRRQPVDYGTGANYGNEPAREVVSTDREWFHMTIVCSDNNAAAWVNGYLVSDFFDCRPMGDIARYGRFGYEPGPGVISLQGHDPTTDLAFRNIHIQDYPGR